MPLSDITLAIAEDHALYRKSIIASLLSAGFKTILEAENGKTLLHRLTNTDVLPDIVLVDISMPDMNGYDTMKAIREKWPEQKTLAMSMYNHEYSIIKMYRNGANGYFLKGGNLNDLVEALISIHERGFYYPPIINANIHNKIHNQNFSLPDLSAKEMQLLEYLCTDLGTKEIATKIGAQSSRVVESYISRIGEKLHVHGRVGIVVVAMKMGLVLVSSGDLR